ncbi:MAG: ABC transporter permease [Anaerolineae bacterium]|nr:ABC transporter permease [Anaerolineae bacterium]
MITASNAKVAGLPPELGPSRLQLWLRAISFQLRKNPLITLGILIVLGWFLVSLFAPLVATAEPLAQNVTNRLLTPGTTVELSEGSSFTYHMGTDELGRDIFSRVVYGGRITIPAGLAVIIIGSLLGTVIGAIAGYAGGLWDELLMRISELFLAFPTIILALAVTAALGPDLNNAILALVVVWWPTYARLVRSLVLEIKSQEFVEAARSIGASNRYILFRTILPNAIAPAIVLATLDIGNAILTFAGLSFLGLGAEPSSPEWGRMVAIGIDFFDQWWMWLYPGLAIASLVMAFNFIGDGLRDVADPRTRNG